MRLRESLLALKSHALEAIPRPVCACLLPAKRKLTQQHARMLVSGGAAASAFPHLVTEQGARRRPVAEHGFQLQVWCGHGCVEVGEHLVLNRHFIQATLGPLLPHRLLGIVVVHRESGCRSGFGTCILASGYGSCYSLGNFDCTAIKYVVCV